MKIIQKHLFKGVQEFELIDDYVKIRSKAPFKDEEIMTVMLTVLNPEPVITSSCLNFTSRVNGEPLLSLYLAKPNAEVFNTFVASLKNRALEEYQAFAGLKSANPSTRLGENVHGEPPAFGEDEQSSSARIRNDLNISRIDESIQMLETYLNNDNIMPLLAALKTLRDDPGSEQVQISVVNTFNALGPAQGAVLTYAPYVGILLSDGSDGAPY